MSTSQRVKKLEEQLKDAGKRLLSPPSSTSGLLRFLDRVHNLLSSVEQAPSKSVQDALFPIMTALISNELLRNPEMDVTISVVCCITEITRITAPDAPYDDDQMKEIFQLTVAAFEKLSHVAGHCYNKAVSILGTVARVRSSLMMLDLECDPLVVEMFQHFLNTIRSNHPHTVFLDMETIMILVVEESEEISLDLLRSLLSSVRKDNQKTSPISWKLGEKVIIACAAKLRPCLMEAVKSKDIALVDYAQIVATIYEKGSGGVKHNSGNDIGEDLEKEINLTGKADLHEASNESKELAPDAAPARNDDNNVIGKGSSKKLQRCHDSMHFKKANSKGNDESDDTLPVKANESGTELDSIPQKRGRRPNSLMNPEEGYYHSWIFSSKKPVNPARRKRSNYDSTDGSPSENPGSASETVTNHHDGSRHKRDRQKKGISARKEPEDNSIIERKTKNYTNKIGLDAKNEGSTAVSGDVIPHNKVSVTCQSDEEPLQQSIVKLGAAKVNKLVPVIKGTKKRRKVVDDKDANKASGGKIKTSETATKPSYRDEDGYELSGSKMTSETSSKPSDGSNKVVKAFGNKIITSEAASKPLHQVTSYMEGACKTSFKRKHVIGREEASEIPADNEELVGSRIKVWWPLDERFYEGVVHSYDPVKKKHKVIYNDGDEERLILKKERWEVIEGHGLLNEGQKTDLLKPDSSSDIFRGPKIYKRKSKSDQAKRDSSSTRHVPLACKSGKKYGRLCKYAESNKPMLKDGSVYEPSAEDDKPEDGGETLAGKQKEDRKEDEETRLDPKQSSHETMTLPKLESPKGDIESSSKKCAIKDADEE